MPNDNIAKLKAVRQNRRTPHPEETPELEEVVVDFNQPSPSRMAVPFPDDAVSGICGDIARMFSSRLEAPFAFWAASALTCLGAAVSGSVTLDTALAPDPRLYTVTVGQTASARKSTAIGFVAEFFADALRPLDILHVEHGLGSAEGLAEVLQRNDDQPSRCLLLIDELKMLVQKARIEHSALLPMLCTMFSRRSFANATRRSKIRLEDVHISILSACTLDTFSTMWTPEFLDIGFLNRLFIVPGDAERSIALPEEIPDAERSRIAARLSRLVEEIHRQTEVRLVVGSQEFPIRLGVPHRLKLTDSARAAWDAWYTARPRSIHARRLEEIGLRLFVLLEVSRGNLQTVESDTVENAVRLLDWELAVRRAYDPLDAENKVALLEQRIKRVLYASGGFLTERELKRRIHAERYGERMYNWAVQNLEEAGALTTTARHRRRYIVALTDAAYSELERDS